MHSHTLSVLSLYQSLYLSHSNLSLTFFLLQKILFLLSISLPNVAPPPPTRSNNSSLQLSYYYWSFFFLCCRLRFFLNSLWSGPNPLFCDVYRSAVNLLKASNHKPSLSSSPSPLNLIIARRPHPNPIPSIPSIMIFFQVIFFLIRPYPVYLSTSTSNFFFLLGL